MKLVSLLCLLLFLVTSCGNGAEDAAEQAEAQAMEAAQTAAYQSMMDGHDRIMPLMGKITQAQRTITEQLTTGGLAEERRELLLATNEQLEDANDGMMNWMNSIRPLDELRAEMDEGKVIDYLKAQTRDIADVETDIKASLANAEEIIGGENHAHGVGADHNH